MSAYKKTFLIGSIFVFLILLGIIICNYYNIIVLSTLSPLFSRLPHKPIIIATIGDRKITENDLVSSLKHTWGQYYDRVKDNKETLTIQKQQIIDEVIMQQHASVLHITVSPQEVSHVYDEHVLQVGGKEAYTNVLTKNGWSESSERQKIYFALLKQKIMLAVINSRTISYANIFVAPDDPVVLEGKAKAKASLEYLQKLLQQGKSFAQIRTILATDPLQNPHMIIVENQRIEEESIATSPELYTQVFAYHKGEITPIIETKGGTMMVGEIIDEVASPYSSFDVWIQKMEEQYKNNNI